MKATIISNRLALSDVFRRRRVLSLLILAAGLSMPRLANAQSKVSASQLKSCGIQLPVAAAQPQSEFLFADQQGEVLFRVDERSGESEKALAEHLAEKEAVVYTAFWCPHCHEQLELFGVEAIARLNVVECDRDGNNAQPELCRQKFQQLEIETGEQAGYPTWEIDGKFYVGGRSLEELADISGYPNPQEFASPPQQNVERGIPSPPREKFLHMFDLQP